MEFNSSAARSTGGVSFGGNRLDTVFHGAVIFAAVALSIAAAAQNWAGTDAAASRLAGRHAACTVAIALPASHARASIA